MTIKLVLSDIADQRAYERERQEFRSQIIELKKRRRVHVGPVLTLVFENRDTIRFQIQEMARVEKLTTDTAIQAELDTYNPLVPSNGELCATVFIELTSEEEWREWLPNLVGIEGCLLLQLGAGDNAPRRRAIADEGHAEQLTRDEITASVHYVRWELTPAEVDLVASGPVSLVVDHSAYQHSHILDVATVGELLIDLQG
ncbi:MAG: DUF3501 family protein [Acidimicrobiia bacterium]|nr:DUF3501 family protein [Acidimicrobiia bacterium]